MLKNSLLAVIAIAAIYGSARADYSLEEREPVHRVFTGDNSLDVEQVNGSISVAGDGGSTIRVEGERIIRADDREQIQRAKREVTLDLNEKDGVAQAYVNGPFREQSSENHGFHDRSGGRYQVIYNLVIHVPRATALTLRTVNGEVRDVDTSGKFDIQTVNGAIAMTNIAGSGTVKTVNGSTTVSFRKNPAAESSFKSFNGKVDISFQPNLSADLQVKTFHGGVYTDFDVTALAAGAAARENGKFIYRSKGSQKFRVGSGGPLLSFETFNGAIQIHKANK